MSVDKRKKSERPMALDLGNDVDFISNMPDEILQFILDQALPNTEEVVRTSFVSPRWRYVWESIPSLDFDCSRVVKHPETFNKNKFKEFVSWALAKKTVDLDSFRLCCAGYYPMSTVCQWIDAAMNRKVKKLDLMVSGWDMDVLLRCLLTCESLKSLRLYFYGSRVELPDCKGYSALKVLELNSVTYSDPDFIKKCLEMCPLLEKLSLIDFVIDDACYILKIKCPKLKTLIIHKGSIYFIGLMVSCPELVFFECVGLRIKYLYNFDKVESLKTAVILPQCSFDEQFYCTILPQISHVESLSLNCRSIRYASDPEGFFPKSLPNLKTLELITTFDSYDMKLLIRILTCSPNLESIHLISYKVCYGSDWNFLSPCLERVKFLGRGKWKLDIAGACKCIGENGSLLV